MLVPEGRTSLHRRETGVFRVALLDSSVRGGFFDFEKMATDEIDLVIFDTTCCWRSSGHIRRVVEWAQLRDCHWPSCAAMRSSIAWGSSMGDLDLW